MKTKKTTLEQLQTLITAEQSPIPERDLNHMRANVLKGQIRPVKYEDENGKICMRYVMVTHQYVELTQIVGVMLIHHLPDLATQDDVKFGPDDIEYPLVGAIQTSNQAPVLLADLGRVVGCIEGELLDLVMGLNRGGHRDATRSGRVVLESDDLRAQIADEEWKVMQLIADEAFQYINAADEFPGADFGQESKLLEIEETRLSLSTLTEVEDLDTLRSILSHYQEEVAA